MANKRGRNQFSINKREYTDKKWLKLRYIDEQRSIKNISEICEVSPSAVAQWLHRLEIPTRGGIGAKGVRNFKWNGGQYISNTGYRYILMSEPHIKGIKKGNCQYVAEHILKMEKMLGRNLVGEETVHHKNGIKTDNRNSNLQLMKNQREHHQYEQKILLFAKQLIWGDSHPAELKESLLKLFQRFLQE